MIRLLHFADLHLGVENYSRINPSTGLSSCFLDFQASLDAVVEFALAQEIDLVVFCGDAYRSRDPSQTHQREFARRIGRLVGKGIAVFLLVGNHDLPGAIGRATAVEIFDTLAVENVTVANQPGVYPIKTKGGTVQILALPWLRRSSLLGREETRHLSLDEIKRRQEETLLDTIKEEARRLDPGLPAILCGHVSVVNAAVGSEKGMILGQDPVIPLVSVANPAFDYVALGHMHRHQVLSRELPPVAYSGSLQRIDFSDEEDIKGFYVVDIDPREKRGNRVALEFHPSEARRFLTIETVVKPEDTNPTATILRDISRRAGDIPGAIVRVRVFVPEQGSGLVQEQEIHRALGEAQYVSVMKEIERGHRTRWDGQSAEGMTPAEALKVYLELKDTSPERTRTLVEYGERLIREVMAED